MVGSSTYLGQREFFSPPGFGPDPIFETKLVHTRALAGRAASTGEVRSSLLRLFEQRPHVAHRTQVAKLLGIDE